MPGVFLCRTEPWDRGSSSLVRTVKLAPSSQFAKPSCIGTLFIILNILVNLTDLDDRHALVFIRTRSQSSQMVPMRLFLCQESPSLHCSIPSGLHNSPEPRTSPYNSLRALWNLEPPQASTFGYFFVCDSQALTITMGLIFDKPSHDNCLT